MRVHNPINVMTIALGLALIIGGFFGYFYTLTSAWFSGVMIFAMALSYQFPRWCLWALLIYLPFGGTIVYTFGGYSLLHLVKDFLYIPALISLGLSRNFREQVAGLVKPIFWAFLPLSISIITTLVLINGWQQIHPFHRDYPLLLGLFGLKVLVGYVPLIFCAYYLIRDRHDLLFFSRLHLGLILTCCILAIIQHQLLATGICPGSRNLEEVGLERATVAARCFVGGSLLYNPHLGLIRLPGTFVAPWQWGWFLISSSFLAYGSLVFEPKRSWQITSLMTIIVLLTTTIISGQRVALVLVPLTLIILFIFTNSEKKWRLVQLFGGIAIALIGTSYLIDLRYPIKSLISRWQASPPYEFIWGQFKWILNNNDVSLLGNGLGRATNAARIFGNTKFLETYYAKILYEIGIFGFLSFLFFVSVLVILTFRSYISLLDRPLRNWGFCLWVFVLFTSYNTFYYPLDVDPVAIYYWFWVGILLKLPRLDIEGVLLPKINSDKNRR